MRILRGFLGICGLAGIVVLLGSYGGAVHPLGDSLAVFRLFIACAVLVGGLVLLLASVRRIGWLAMFVAAMALTPIGLAMALSPTSTERPSLTIYTKNVLGGWGDNEAIIADIRASGADVVMLQELSPNRGGFAEALSDTHPYQHICAFSDWSTMAVMSRWPVDETYCSPRRTIAAAQVAHPDGPIWAVAHPSCLAVPAFAG